ncbi:hypothetical protein VN97_g8474 [Penicillium thymicola]|uniref:Uncharacterized protein n=1 Tax=Penicillium thymicola TaxID=293382 RepID=A0AAI9TDB2_PENTH|nr:hypothetical protein VN97_g8474 [Penicillium thymicola]
MEMGTIYHGYSYPALDSSTHDIGKTHLIFPSPECAGLLDSLALNHTNQANAVPVTRDAKPSEALSAVGTVSRALSLVLRRYVVCCAEAYHEAGLLKTEEELAEWSYNRVLKIFQSL